MDNPEKLATYGTKDEDKQKQTHNTECIGLHHAQTNTRRVWRYQREVIRIRITDNTMANKKKYERINNDLQNIHIKLKIE